MTRNQLGCGLGIAALALLVACGSDETTYETEGGKVTVGDDGGAIQYEGDDGGRVEISPEGDAGTPEDFPDDIPRLDDAETVMSSITPDQGMMVMLRSGKEAAELFEFYKGDLEGNGWVLAREQNMAGQHLIMATKDGRELNILIGAGGDGQTQVALRMRQQQ